MQWLEARIDAQVDERRVLLAVRTFQLVERPGGAMLRGVHERRIIGRNVLSRPESLDFRHGLVGRAGVTRFRLHVRDEDQVHSAGSRHTGCRAAKLIERFRISLALGERAGKQGSGGCVLRVHAERLLKMGDRFVEARLEEKMPSDVAVNQHRHRFERLCPLDLRHGFVLTAHGVQVVRVPVMRERVLRVQADGFSEADVRPGKVPVVEERRKRERGVGFGQIRIAIERLLGRSLASRLASSGASGPNAETPSAM
jgi:hypothetical protein